MSSPDISIEDQKQRKELEDVCSHLREERVAWKQRAEKTEARVRELETEVERLKSETNQFPVFVSSLLSSLTEGSGIATQPVSAEILEIELGALTRMRPIVVGLVEEILDEIRRGGDQELHRCVEFRRKMRSAMLDRAMGDVLGSGLTGRLEEDLPFLRACMRRKFERMFEVWAEYDFQPMSKLSDLASSSIWDFNQSVMKMAMKSRPGDVPLHGLLIPHGWSEPGWSGASTLGSRR